MKENYGFKSTKMPEHHQHGDKSYSTKPLNVGIIGVGGLGGTLAHYLLTTSKNSVVHLAGRPKNTGTIEARVRVLISRDGNGDVVNEERVKERIRIYQTIRGETSVNAKGELLESKERLLDADFILVSVRDNSMPFNSFKSRDDEYLVNKPTVRDIAENLEGYKGIVINATGPLELFCEEISDVSGIPLERIVGASYVDTLRFRKELQRQIYNLVGQLIDLPLLEEAIVLGCHRSSMVPIYSKLNLFDKSFNDISELNNEGLRRRVKEALLTDPNVMQLTGSTSVNISDPALAIYEMILGLSDRRKIVGSVFDGECFMSYPCWTESNSMGLNIVRADIDILDPIKKRISDNERKKVYLSKQEIVNLRKKLKRKSLKR